MYTEAKLDAHNEQRLQQAIHCQQSDQADKALAQYRIILEHYPEHAMIHHLIGITFAQLDQLDDAIKSLETANRLHPNHPIYLSNLANAKRRQGDHQQAVVLFEQALSINPNLISAHNNIALIYFTTQPDKAQKHLESALAINPQHIDANFNLGLLLSHNNPFRASQCWQHVINQQPQHTGALRQLAQQHHSEKAYLKALPLYEKILTIQPNDPECLNKIGLLHLEQDAFEKGLSYLEKAYAIADDIEDIHHNLACCYLHQRQYQKALEHWLKYIKHNASLDTYYNIGVCYLYLGRYEDCSDHLFHVIREDPKHYKALINLGAAFLQKGQATLASEYYTRAQAIQPTPSIAYILAAIAQTNAPSSAPSEYVTDLFDNYAYHYDEHLCNILQYQVPKRIATLIPEIMHLEEKSQVALDLGCGTGLSPYCKTLIGIDLSENMLAQAQRKNIYDQTLCCDIIQDQPQLHKHIDFVLMADTVPYFGDLQALFAQVKQYLKPGGHWLFSVEKQDNTDYALTEAARYAHNSNYIEQCAHKHGFTCMHYENIQLRTQQKHFIEGYLFLLQHN